MGMVRGLRCGLPSSFPTTDRPQFGSLRGELRYVEFSLLQRQRP